MLSSQTRGGQKVSNKEIIGPESRGTDWDQKGEGGVAKKREGQGCLRHTSRKVLKLPLGPAGKCGFTCGKIPDLLETMYYPTDGIRGTSFK